VPKHVGAFLVIYKVKAKVKQSNYSPGEAPRVPGKLKLPDFKTIGT
jgi:hypothetical protein